jgi:hypothetical protein
MANSTDVARPTVPHHVELRSFLHLASNRTHSILPVSIFPTTLTTMQLYSRVHSSATAQKGGKARTASARTRPVALRVRAEAVSAPPAPANSDAEAATELSRLQKGNAVCRRGESGASICYSTRLLSNSIEMAVLDAALSPDGRSYCTWGLDCRGFPNDACSSRSSRLCQRPRGNQSIGLKR